MNTQHERYMRVALSLAERQLGRTWPNPSVGAIIVKNGQIISQGITATGGRPHAETIAIENAGEQARNATLYVTLEPCSHHGKTPPCVDAIIAAGIKTIVIACKDPNPLVNSTEILKKANIEIIEDICKEEAKETHQGFFSIIEKKRPYIALKIATSLDDKITNPNGRWLTSERARNYGQLLRSKYDAIATGSGTIIADDPLLTCRLAGLESHSPLRIILDRSGKTPKTAKIFPASLITEKTLPEAIEKLTERGITRLLIEAGATLSQAFIEAGLVDKIYWFRAPITIGESGLSISLNLANFKQTDNIKLENDKLKIFTKNIP